MTFRHLETLDTITLFLTLYDRSFVSQSNIFHVVHHFFWQSLVHKRSSRTNITCQTNRAQHTNLQNTRDTLTDVLQIWFSNTMKNQNSVIVQQSAAALAAFTAVFPINSATRTTTRQIVVAAPSAYVVPYGLQLARRLVGNPHYCAITVAVPPPSVQV